MGILGGVLVNQPVVSGNLWDLEGELTVGMGRKARMRTWPLAFIPPMLKPDIFDIGLVVKYDMTG